MEYESEPSMLFGVKVRLKATAPLTFRQIPFSMINIKTYPFIPPTTLSGWLERLHRIANGHEIPFKSTIPEKDEEIKWIYMNGSTKAERIFLDWKKYCCLGALPLLRENPVNLTYRQGPKSFRHKRFSDIKKLRSADKKEEFQLHRWEFITPIDFEGLIISNEQKSLNEILRLQRWGLNIGKEGYAFVHYFSEIFELRGPVEMVKKPSTIVPIQDTLSSKNSEYYPLYYFNPEEKEYYLETFAIVEDEIKLKFWIDVNNQIFIPESLLQTKKYFCWW